MDYFDKKQTRFSKRSRLVSLALASYLSLANTGLILPNTAMAEELAKKKGESAFSYLIRKASMPEKMGGIDAIRPSKLVSGVTGKEYSNNYTDYFFEDSDFWAYTEGKEVKEISFVLEDIANDGHKFVPTNNKYMNGTWEKISYSKANEAIEKIMERDGRQPWETSAIRLIAPCSINKEGWRSVVLGYGFPERELKFDSKSPDTYTVRYMPTISPDSDGGDGPGTGDGDGAGDGSGGEGGGDGF